MEIFKTEERFAGIQFGKDFALIEDQARISRLLRTFEIDPSQAQLRSQADLEPQSRRIAIKIRAVPWSAAPRRARRMVGGGFGGRGGGDSTLVQSGESILLPATARRPKATIRSWTASIWTP